MQKVVIDTNVIVSALIQKNYPFLIINELFLEGKVIVCISEELMREYFEVLSRPKFARFPDFANGAKSVLAEIGSKAELFDPEIKLDIISDQDDNMILELADESEADFIITGNTNDFTMSAYKNTKIVTPREYWEYYKPE
ncbi:MAG: putative toxin-antitoxin system toxin component, PIN family [Cytophagaceae bacterium SCN 52-12]|nr:MAG: putative toxin-antitoxin system toxin component, PIN family [Cytophagaceae bacterium SCN 52-12]